MNAKEMDKEIDQKTGRPAGGGAPEPLAVAVDYAPAENAAPKVVAKGQGWLAEQIIAIAEANGIEVREDADLAQLLATVEVDSEIPLEAFTAVAEILSYVYRLNDSWPEGIAPANADTGEGIAPANADTDKGMAPANADTGEGMAPANAGPETGKPSGGLS